MKIKLLFCAAFLGVAVVVNAQTNTFPTSGNVGIGTTSPSNKLHIVETSQTELYGTDNSAPVSNLNLQGNSTGRAVGQGPALTFSFPANTDGTNIWTQARILATPDNASNGNAVGRLYFQVRDWYNPGCGGSWNWRTGLMIAGNGNVGIGTNNPIAALSIVKPSNDASESQQGFVLYSGLGDTKLQMGAVPSAYSYIQSMRQGYDWTSRPLIFQPNGGNVGIGTNSPSEKLDIVGGNIRSSGLIYSTQDGYPQTYLRSWGLSGDGHIYIEPASSNDLILTDSWARQGTLDIYFGRTVFNTGNVLIGKTSQTNTAYKLDVSGKVRADEITVNTTGADFVFEPKYKLLTLAEVEAFIKANKHLPDIAPATDMQTNGVSMGEMQAKLLQKVEELTLYTIEQSKQLQEQRQTNTVLEKKFAEQAKDKVEQDKKNADLQQQLAAQAKEIEELKQLITQKLK